MSKVCILILTFLVLRKELGTTASFLDYIWPNRNVQPFNSGVQNLPRIPFETTEHDEKFLTESAKLFSIKPSELDFCQQRVILLLKTSCSSLNEEQLGKLAVSLMNCQALTEGRQVYECTDNMSLKGCTQHMSPETWNIYQFHFNRAKSVCLHIRQQHFRGFVEISVDKLAQSTAQSIATMEELRNTQRSAQESTNEMVNNNLKLIDQQQDLLKASKAQRIGSEENISELLKEKKLIKDSQTQMTLFISDLKTKIEASMDDIQEQNQISHKVYKNLVDDLEDLQTIAQKISVRLEEAGLLVLDQNKITRDQFKETILQLNNVSDIILDLSKTIGGLYAEYNNKIEWLSAQFGTRDHLIKPLSLIAIHVICLLIGMLVLVFINSAPSARILFLLTLLISLFGALYDFIEFNIITLIGTVFAVLTLNYATKLFRKHNIMEYFTFDERGKANGSNASDSNKTNNVRHLTVNNKLDNKNLHNGFGNGSANSRLLEDHRSQATDSYPMHAEDRFSDRSRSVTPFTSALLSGNRCKALTVRGTPCQLMSSMYGDFCRVHASKELSS